MTDLNDVIAWVRLEIDLHKGPYYGYDDASYYRTTGALDKLEQVLQYLEEVDI